MPTIHRKFGTVFSGNLLVLLLVLAGALVLAACTTPATPAATVTTAATTAVIATATAVASPAVVASPSPVATVAPATATTAAPTQTATTAAATKAATVAVALPSVTVPPALASAVSSAVAGAGNTIGALAAQGTVVFGRSCAVCHGPTGQGAAGAPAVLPPNAKLGVRFATAADLDKFVRTRMPQTQPGSLPAAEYDQVVSFLLAGNNLATAADQFTPARLEQIKLR